MALAASAAATQAAEPPDLDSCEGTPTATRLQVTVTGVRSAEGLVTVTLYPDDSRRFLVSKGKIGLVRVKAESPVSRVCLALPGPGHYAVVAYHDVNANRKFNRTAIGLPAEDYGVSNDPPTVLGLPSFSKVRFPTRTGDNAITIRLRSAKKR